MAAVAALAGPTVMKMEGDDRFDTPVMPYVGAGQLNPSTRSFKIVMESRLVVMFLFQLFTKLVQTNIPFLLPMMVEAISIPGPDKVLPHLKTQFVELKGAQVKIELASEDLAVSASNSP